VSRSLDEARSLGAKISSKTVMLTTVDTPLPAGNVASAVETPQAPVVKPPQETAQSVKPKAPIVAPADKPKQPTKQQVVIDKPKKQPAKPVEQASRKPKTYKIVTHLAPGQVLAEDELELVGKVPDGTIPANTLRPYRPQQVQAQQQQMPQMPQFQMPQFQMPQMQMPQMQMPQMQMPQIQMPQVQMPQIQMPQLKLPGGMQLQMPQLQLPIGRSAERSIGAEQEVASTTPPVCADMLDKLNGAVAAKDIASAAADADAIAISADCGQFQIVAQRRIAALRLSAAQDMMTANQPLADYEPMLVAADAPGVLWQASATLGEIYFNDRRFADAAADYQQAIEIIKNETRTPKAPPAETIDGLIQRAAQARILAANPTSTNPDGTFVPVEKDHRSGVLGGIYSEDVRGIVPISIPVPITFDYDKSSFTSIGSEAAQELLEALKEQKPGKIILVGHTDRRGGDDYNQKLSVRRAQAVADFLKSNGIDASIDAEGRGASEPVDVAATPNLTDDDIDALNRRVEWRRE
jgi:outer membrane protein OmpA-like peptidoglycan-associated protein